MNAGFRSEKRPKAVVVNGKVTPVVYEKGTVKVIKAWLLNERVRRRIWWKFILRKGLRAFLLSWLVLMSA